MRSRTQENSYPVYKAGNRARARLSLSTRVMYILGTTSLVTPTHCVRFLSQGFKVVSTSCYLKYNRKYPLHLRADVTNLDVDTLQQWFYCIGFYNQDKQISSMSSNYSWPTVSVACIAACKSKIKAYLRRRGITEYLRNCA